MVRELCVRHNVLCVSDEVYEWLVYPPMTHVKIGKDHHLAPFFICVLLVLLLSPKKIIFYLLLNIHDNI